MSGIGLLILMRLWQVWVTKSQMANKFMLDFMSAF